MAELEIELNDILNIKDEEELKRTKIVLHKTHKKENPYDLYLSKPDELITKWQLWSNHKYKEGDITFGFVKKTDNIFLLACVEKITKIITRIPPSETTQETKSEITLKSTSKSKNKKIEGYQKYESESVEQYKNLIGRLTIRVKKPDNLRRWMEFYAKYIDLFTVDMILKSVEELKFPGYDNVKLSFNELKNIIYFNNYYANALSLIQAVYVITDIETGKLYIGSATSKENGLLGRWADYIKTYHGDDKALVKLLKEKGKEYFEKNFQYSIIEYFLKNKDDDYIKAREQYWKGVFDTKNHGYNRN